MKTKYILHGGAAQIINKENDPFYAEILKDTPDKLKILLVYFANDPERNEERKGGNVEQFNRVKGNKEIEYEIAREDTFLDQIRKSDIVYIRGGSTPVLMKALSRYNNLKEAFKGKIVSGESAGMNSLVKYCYSKSGGGVTRGLGIIKIKTISHFDGIRGIKELEEVAPDLESGYYPKNDKEVLLRLGEEVGEVFEAIREKQSRDDLSHEIVDVFWNLLRLCELKNIDLEKAFIEKIEINELRPLKEKVTDISQNS